MKRILTLALALVTPVLLVPNGLYCKAESLPRSTPEEQGISSAALVAYVEATDRKIDAMNSVMLIRHGHVVLEGWWNPYSAADQHMLYSLSKSFASTAIGIAVGEGRLDVNDMVFSFFPEHTPSEPSEHLLAMRVRDLLTMNTGQRAKQIEKIDLYSDESATAQFLSVQVDHKPGTMFAYNTPATYMCSAIVQKLTGEKLIDYLGPRLFEPLGIEGPTWQESVEGVSLGGTGLNITTEDIAKFGQLYLQKGKWGERQLIPAKWVEEATLRQVSTGSNPDSDWDQGYGYQFWRCRHGFYRGDGAHGQFCIVMPQYDAVLAITCGTRDLGAIMSLAWEHLLPAMQDTPLPADEKSYQRLVETTSNLLLPVPQGAATSPIAAQILGRMFVFDGNEKQLQSLRLEYVDGRMALVLGDAVGEHRVVCGHGKWIKGAVKSLASLEGRVRGQTDLELAATGAWIDDSTYSVKICHYKTPFYLTLKLRFEGEQLVLDSEYNLPGDGAIQPRLIGRARQ